jgi:tRNA/tmRNA/rRNA uracil-C5-methylase (TrmA/RlmC/RlmD family)
VDRLVTLDIEKPAAGGRMLGRHEGQVVLVWGAIPGERVRARIERAGKSLLYADTVEVVSASPDRRDPGPDWRCGGNALAHIAYPRQLQLKSEIIRDGLNRIGRLSLADAPDVWASPEQGYRMRARLHARDGRLGFFREGTHELCPVGGTRQLLPDTVAWVGELEQVCARQGLTGLAGIEFTENAPGNERAAHAELQAGADAAPFVALADTASLKGVSASRGDRPGVMVLSGTPAVTDAIQIEDAGPVLHLTRDARSFFQGNRYLLERLVRHVVSLVPGGPIVDLYAGVGLFGLAVALAGADGVTLIEGDPVSGADLQQNAKLFGARTRVDRVSVEAFLRAEGKKASGRAGHDRATFIVDPPRTGMSKEALANLLRLRPANIVYVSCDVATFARDARMVIDGGYVLQAVQGIDLFPNTAHVETVAAFSRTTAGAGGRT